MSFFPNLRPRVWTPAPKELVENPRSGEQNARPQADVRRQRRKPARLQSETERGLGPGARGPHTGRDPRDALTHPPSGLLPEASPSPAAPASWQRPRQSLGSSQLSASEAAEGRHRDPIVPGPRELPRPRADGGTERARHV